jgi:hypothetical protein
MKKSEKVLVTGIAVGAVVALFLIPRSRKVISDLMCSITGTLKNIMPKAENLADRV